MPKKSKPTIVRADTNSLGLLECLETDLLEALVACRSVQKPFWRSINQESNSAIYSARCELTHRLGRIAAFTQLLFEREEKDLPILGIFPLQAFATAQQGVFMQHAPSVGEKLSREIVEAGLRQLKAKE